MAAVVDDISFGAEDAVGQPIVAHELPDVLDRVQLGAFGRQRHQRDVGRHDKPIREMPSGLVDQQHCVRAGRDGDGHLGQMQVHGGDVAAGQHEAGALAEPGADRAEDIGRGCALILRRRRPSAAPSPTAGDLVLLADPGLVGEPNLYVGWIATLALRDFRQTGGETFLKSSIAPAACA
jgi:hypothetical protein